MLTDGRIDAFRVIIARLFSQTFSIYRRCHSVTSSLKSPPLFFLFPPPPSSSQVKKIYHLSPVKRKTSCFVFFASWRHVICCAATDKTGKSMRLNSSKQPQEPDWGQKEEQLVQPFMSLARDQGKWGRLNINHYNEWFEFDWGKPNMHLALKECMSYVHEAKMLLGVMRLKEAQCWDWGAFHESSFIQSHLMICIRPRLLTMIFLNLIIWCVLNVVSADFIFVKHQLSSSW